MVHNTSIGTSTSAGVVHAHSAEAQSSGDVGHPIQMEPDMRSDMLLSHLSLSSSHEYGFAASPHEAEKGAGPSATSEVIGIMNESRTVEQSQSEVSLGGSSLLKNVRIIRKSMKAQTRAIVYTTHREDLGSWVTSESAIEHCEESALEALPALPIIRSNAWKRSPSKIRSVCGKSQERLCVLKDGHFLWWEPAGLRCSDEARGCLNFLVHQAEVVLDQLQPTIFMIRPSQPCGWKHASTFGGGAHRTFTFDTAHCLVSRDEWVCAIQKHIDFGKLALEQLGETAVLEQVGVRKPSFREVHACAHVLCAGFRFV